MQNRQLIIKTMSKADLEVAVEWAAQEGWNPGLSDADCYYAADPSGFLMGYLDDEPIASISVVKYNNEFGFLGFYIVKPAYRGQGYGWQLWQAGLEYLKGCNVGLDGVLAQQDNYKKSGFKLAYSNIRYEGKGGANSPTDTNIVPLSALPFEQVCQYEADFFPVERRCFLQQWITQSNSHALGILHQGKLAGYGVIRPCRTGFKIGPLFADSNELAESLFLALSAKVTASDAIFLDVPEVNAGALALAKRYDMQPSFETARMYTPEHPALPLNRIFGVTSFEIG
ncbi:GNAT family N-acetyltransferase [Pseudoalteromonas sp. JBTF-M23]|uniref:GNAT family N-acetyltransferase n=1 Tax=Pseudoalteromonas caenipelagi TaxID=2726988 RepID=A0A849VDT9_9GAMM|nr:GNAT family N-acetyltransferase [Pseudoalteromonas caenipelagi]NOU51456.1 GNAT family N-acetyltransferase [Pseudoalteromonas caenipelagi]